MGEDFAKLFETTVGLGSLGREPLLLARAVDQRGVRRKAYVVRQGFLPRDSVRIRRVRSSAGCGVAFEAQRGERRRGDGRGDSVVLVDSAIVVPSKAYELLDKFDGDHSAKRRERG